MNETRTITVVSIIQKQKLGPQHPRKLGGFNSPPTPTKKNTKKIFKKFVISAFHCVVFLASKLVLKFKGIQKPSTSNFEHYFSVKIS